MEGSSEELVGRERECAELDAVLDRLSSDPRTHPVLLAGEPGIGKTRLLDRLCSEGSERGHLVLEGKASEFEEELPFGPFRAAFDDYLAAQPARRLAPLGEASLLELGAAFPALAPDGGATVPALGSAEERFRLHERVRSLLELLAAHQPLLLALDDMHWSDAASLELLGHLVRRPPRAPVLLAVVSRAGDAIGRIEVALGQAARDAGLTRVELGPLSREAALLMVEGRADPDRAERLLAESGGNPFYLDELLRQAAPGPTPAGEGAGSAGLPGSVTAALASELAGLPEPTRDLVHAAAVAGESFDRDLLAVASGTADELGAGIDDLVARDLIRPGDSPLRFRFRHPIVRAAVYESAGPAARAGIHARLAAELAAREAPAAERAIHVEASASRGDEEAIELLVEAARAVAPTAPGSAARWRGAAMRLLPEGDPRRPALLAQQADAFAAEGRYEEARAALAEVLPAIPPEAPTLRIAVAASCARLDHLLGRHVEAHDLLRSMLSELPDEPSAALLSLKLELGADCFFRGDFEGLREWMRQVLEESGGVGDDQIAAAAIGLLGCAEYMAGDAPRAKALLDEFFGEVSQSTDSQLGEHVNTLAWCIVCEVFVEGIDAAIVHSERALAAARATGKGQITSLIRIGGALALLWRGRIAEGNALAEEAVDATILAGNHQFESWARWTRSWGALLAGDVEAALREGRRSVELARGLEDPVSAFAGCHVGEALLESGDPAGCSDALLRSAGGEELPLVERPYRSRWYEVLARADLEAGRTDAAEAWTVRAEECAEGQGLDGRSCEALRARARLLLARGDATAAAELARASAEAASRSNLSIWEGVSLTLLGQALATAGEADAALEELERARRLLEDAGALRYADAAARELRTLGRKVPRRGVRARSSGGVGALSGRESEVAELAAAGRTNREIAASMFISEKTVEKHMARVFEKLGVGSRAEVAHRIGRESAPAEPTAPG